MKKQLTDELIIALMPYISPAHTDDVAMAITMVLNDYNVNQEERSLVLYENNETEAVFRRFLAAKIAKGCSQRTVGYYKTSISKALRIIGKPYDQVTADDIRYYLAMRVQKDGVSKSSANNERRNLSAFYQWLQKEEILLKNPMSKVEVMKETKRKKKAFTQMDIEKIRDSAGTSREKALIEVLLSTWARVTEVSQIRIDEIVGGTVTVHGKGDKDRDVYLTPKAQLLVDKYLQERSDSNPYLFPRAKYAGDIKKMTQNRSRGSQAEWYKDPRLVDETRHIDQCTVESIVRKIGKRAGVENVHPHRFRRTGATMALRSGMPLLQVSKLLGHEQIDTTQIYLDISDQELMQAHEKFVV
jgi:site-specific recombinase XerD